ncbi:MULTISPECIES: hypothetical protein [unclassified Burkholderia]|uniref:hypothetical protein n=1 Tax=unclassified Burkholderia TaxID=2613784 RepID=UPI000F568E1F|nr:MULTISPECIES: hypothetical protein [unclassified Burkholderia]
MAARSARDLAIRVNPMEVAPQNVGAQGILPGLWYVGRFVHTVHGWRNAERIEARRGGPAGRPCTAGATG